MYALKSFCLHFRFPLGFEFIIDREKDGIFGRDLFEVKATDYIVHTDIVDICKVNGNRLHESHPSNFDVYIEDFIENKTFDILTNLVFIIKYTT